jgi:DNA ligase-1
MLATAWRPGLDLSHYWVSEKLDGMRGHWDGQRLWSRGGQRIHSPAWFTAGWPAQALDGELWAGSGGFEQTVSTVRQLRPQDGAWQAIRFMVFDLPDHPGPFGERLQALRTLLAHSHAQWLQAIDQDRAASEAELQAWLERVVAMGGEGLMLHHAGALYRGERSAQLLKLKLWNDAEARVIAHLPGKGQHTGKLGALLVEMPADGAHGPRIFRLGSGLEERDRLDPPAIGSVVSFRHQGFTASGLPRFASFWRVRPPE